MLKDLSLYLFPILFLKKNFL
uniref:Uncharacterized protein n=1 Tax=Heterorhabditis bacteriophora TaxID=37862 RepID=A0A1I7WVB6_HETBA